MMVNAPPPTPQKSRVIQCLFVALSRGYVDVNIVRNVVIDDDTQLRNRVLSSDERQRLHKPVKNHTGINFTCW